jgi:hypothetical protein
MKIDKNIPIPVSNSGRPSKWPFSKMEINESVLVDGQSCMTSKCPGYNAAQQIARNHGKKFIGRYEGGNKVRIWRIE